MTTTIKLGAKTATPEQIRELRDSLPTPTQPINVEYVSVSEVRCTNCNRVLAKNLQGSVELKCRGCKHTQKYSS